MQRVDDHELRILHRLGNAPAGEIALALAAGTLHLGRAFGLLGLLAQFLQAHLQPLVALETLERVVDRGDHHETRQQRPDQTGDRLRGETHLRLQRAAAQHQ